MRGKFLSIVGCALLVVSCSSARQDVKPFGDEKVTARLLRIDPVEQSDVGTTAHVVLRITNPQAKPVLVKKADIEVSFADDFAGPHRDTGGDEAVEDEEPDEDGESEPGSGGDGMVEVSVFEGSVSPDKAVAAGSQLDIAVPVEISYPEDADAYVSFCKLGVVAIDIEGSMETSIGTFAIDDNGEFPTPTLPEATAHEVQVARTGDSASLSMSLRIFNANVFSWKIRDWQYKVYVGGKKMREATVGLGERINSNTAIQYDITVPLNERSFGPEVRQLLTAPSIGYRVDGVMRFRDMSIRTDIDGEVQFSN